MGWKVRDVVTVREEFVLQAIQDGASVSGLCRDFGISRKTGYKWLARYRERGLVGLQDRSRRPLSAMQVIDVDVVARLVELRDVRCWGPKKLRTVLVEQFGADRVPSVATLGRLLRRMGLTESKGRGRPRRWEPERPRLEARAPNELWTIDFKGWWPTMDGKRCEPLTLRDAYSRFVLCAKPLAKRDTATVQDELTRVFKRFGVPRRILCDNGAPFASRVAPHGLTRLSAWWRMLGIETVRTQVGHPEQNGAHERMHADIARDVERNPARTIAQEAARLERWRRIYNGERPHEALGMKRPGELYRASRRRLPDGIPTWPYPPDYAVRRVSRNGTVKIGNRLVFISEALSGWRVGLDVSHGNPNPSHLTPAWFCNLHLGEVDLEAGAPLRPPASAALPPEAVPPPLTQVLPMS